MRGALLQIRGGGKNGPPVKGGKFSLRFCGSAARVRFSLLGAPLGWFCFTTKEGSLTAHRISIPQQSPRFSCKLDVYLWVFNEDLTRPVSALGP